MTCLVTSLFGGDTIIRNALNFRRKPPLSPPRGDVSTSVSTGSAQRNRARGPSFPRRRDVVRDHCRHQICDHKKIAGRESFSRRNHWCFVRCSFQRGEVVSGRRSFYTREDAARLCRRSLRTIIRWEEEEGLLTRLSDPSDPTGRLVRYAGAEVEALARRLRRLQDDDTLDDERAPEGVPRDRESSRPKVPRRRRPPPRHLTPPKPVLAQGPPPRSTLRPPSSTKEPQRPTSAPPEGVPSPPPVPKPTLVSHAPLADDVEAEKWLREIDERKRAWEEAEADTIKDDEVPPSSASRR